MFLCSGITTRQLCAYNPHKCHIWKLSHWIFSFNAGSKCCRFISYDVRKLLMQIASWIHTQLTSHIQPGYLSFICLCPGVPAGTPRVYPGHLGSLDRRAWQSARDQMALRLSEIPPGQLLPYHALSLQRMLLQHRSTAGLWVWQSIMRENLQWRCRLWPYALNKKDTFYFLTWMSCNNANSIGCVKNSVANKIRTISYHGWRKADMVWDDRRNQVRVDGGILWWNGVSWWREHRGVETLGGGVASICTMVFLEGGLVGLKTE